MWGEKCTIDRAANDLYLFCWNNGCRFEDILFNTEANVLYMTRAMIDAAIVWYEGIPENRHTDIPKWFRLSQQTGETVAEIIKEMTDFIPQTDFKEKEFVFRAD
jgi:hypothetical protein